MVVIKQSGNFNNTENFFKSAKANTNLSVLEKYAKEGVAALALATPVDSSLTAHSWNYEISTSGGYFSIRWTNSNMADKVPVAILLQYGHATKNGGYVQGYDYINPALKPIFDKIAEEVWKEVTN